MGGLHRGVRRSALAALVAALATSCRQSAPAWSPDGGTVVFGYEQAAGGPALASCELESGEVRVLFEGEVHSLQRDAAFMRPLFEADGERVVVLSGSSELVSECEVLTLAADGEVLRRKVFEMEWRDDRALAFANLLPSFVVGSSLWFAWSDAEQGLGLVYRRFDLERNELSDDVIDGIVLIPGGDELFYFESGEGDALGFGRFDLGSRERTQITAIELRSRAPAALGLCAVGARRAALLFQPVDYEGVPGHGPVELLLVGLEDGEQRSVELGELGECGDFVLGAGDRELIVLATQEGGLWLHRVSTADGSARSTRLFGPAPHEPVADRLLALEAALSLSPDGTRLAISVFSSAHAVGQPDLYVYELGDELRTVGRFHAPR